MRNLTIKRAKRFVGCAGVMKVYIEDPGANDTTINGVTCRFLGKLKNGEEKTFSVSENAARIFVIADQLSKGFCNEYYPLPEGSQDVTLTGKNHFNPAAGNPFRFDGVTDPDVMENRKKGAKKGLAILIAAIIVGVVVGGIFGGMISNALLSGPAEPKDFSVNGMQITLTDDFKKQSASGFTAGYGTKEVAVLILEEAFSLQAGFGDLSLQEYAKLVLDNSGHAAQIKTENGVTYFEYDATGGNGKMFHYIAAMYKGPDAFWLIQFATEQKNAEEHRNEIFEWAKSVRFD